MEALGLQKDEQSRFAQASRYFFSNTMTKLNHDEMVAMPILDRICDTLNVDYGDIVEYVEEIQTMKL